MAKRTGKNKEKVCRLSAQNDWRAFTKTVRKAKITDRASWPRLMPLDKNGRLDSIVQALWKLDLC
jgi:hypothetical protein